jgi:hypothetical protein
MSTVTITDLPMNRALDYKAMSFIKGAGGAMWVFAFRAFAPERPPFVNFYQTNNFFVADQLNVQFQTIDVDASTAANAVINIDANQRAGNLKIGA